MTRLLIPILAVLAFTPMLESKREIDNEFVRVVRETLAPREQAVVHHDLASVVVYLTDAHLKINSANGKVKEVSPKAGDVGYFAEGLNREENLSASRVEAVVVELKPSKSRSAPVALDPVKLDPQHHLVPLQNARVRVLRTILEPHLKSPEHEHPHYVVVYLTELHTTQTLPDGRVVDNPRKAGDIGWRDALKHITENIAEKRAEEIQIELK